MLDITASKTYYYDEYIGYDTKDEVAGFTLSSKLNDYEDTYDFFKNNADEIIVEQIDNIYVYNRETFFRLKEENAKLNLGKDVDEFIDKCIKSNIKKLYIEIF
mgnify:CR=1 FL=1